jgi:hypothetical protein
LYCIYFMPSRVLTILSEKSGERQELDEDDWEKVDRETIKAREWDEFKEQNPR